MNKIKKEHLLYIFFVIAIICLIDFLTSDDHGYVLLASVLFLSALIKLLNVIYNKYKNKYNNVKYYVILLWLILIIFPLSHYACYSYDKDYYTLNQEYLIHNQDKSELELTKINKSINIDSLLITLPKYILEKKISNNLINKNIKYSNYTIKVRRQKKESSSSSNMQNSKSLFFLNKKNALIGSIDEINDEKIIDVLNEKLKKKTEIKRAAFISKNNIHFGDLWLDSITVFVFSNIKPVNRLPQLLQFFQIITLFIFGYMTTTLMDTFKVFKITKKEKNE